jgi:competence protein ComGC
MKIIILILSVLLLACTAPKIEMPTGILSEKVCASILKEIHLEEAAFELNKSKGVINAKNSLATSYQSIYKKHNIDDSTFSKSLEYYAKHPEIFEKIYSTVLEQLTNERSTLNPQETN